MAEIEVDKSTIAFNLLLVESARNIAYDGTANFHPKSKGISTTLNGVENMPKYTSHEIESRVELSHKMFHQLESYVDDFLNYVPFDFCHLEVYSLKLVAVILEIGPELMSSFELAVSETNVGVSEFFGGTARRDRDELWEKEKKLRDRKRSLTFNDYYCFLNKHGTPRLSSAIIELRGFDVHIMPFEEQSLQWWENHNLLKHDKYSNLKTATLKTTLKALSALFWLVDRNSRMFSFEKPFLSSLFLAKEGYESGPSFKKL